MQRWLASEQTRATLVVVAFAIGLRVLTALLALFINLVFPLFQREQFTVFYATDPFWDAFARYDSGWYFGIARNGYEHVEGGRSNIAFFPVYPLLMGWLGRALGGRQYHYYQAGVLISWAAFTVALVLLQRLARLDLDERGARHAALYAAIFPFSFFFGVVYSESLFLALMVGAFLAFRTGWWLPGGVAGGLATATRPNGIMALPALAWITVVNLRGAGLPPSHKASADGLRQGYGGRGRMALAGVSLVLVASGLAAYCVYVYTLTGSLTEWAPTLRRWGYYPGSQPLGPFIGLIRELVTHPYAYLTSHHAAPYDVLNGGTAILFTAAIPFVWARLGAAYGLFMLTNLWLPLSSGQFEGLGRYCAVLFPVYIWLASFRSSAIHHAVVVAFAMLYTLCLALFTTIRPIF